MPDNASVIRCTSAQNEQDDCKESEGQLDVLAVDFAYDNLDLIQFGFHVFCLSAKKYGLNLQSGRLQNRLHKRISLIKKK